MRDRRKKQRPSPAGAEIELLEQRRVLSGVNCCEPNAEALEQLNAAAESSVVGIQSFSAASDQSGTINGRIGGFNRSDWFRLDVESDSTAEFQLSQLSGNLSLQLFSRRGLIDTSTNPGRSNEFIQSELEPGRYYLRVIGGLGVSSSYRLDWSLQSSAPADLAGNSRGAARDLGTLGSATADDWVGPADSSDFYRFTVDQNSDVSISVSANANLELQDANGRRLAIATNPNDRSLATELDEGTYYAVVTENVSAATPYSITIDATAVVADPPPGDGGDADEFPDVPDLPGFSNWHLNSINAPEVWAQGFTGDDVLVAVVDTGVRLNHPDLVSNIYVNPGEIVGNGIDDDGNGFVDDVSGWDFTSNSNDPNDVNGHGTHVAGIIAAASNGFGATGVAFNASILPVQVLGDDGRGSNFGVAQGIRYAVDNGADIINLSLGGGFSTIVQSAIQYAELNDVLVVAAAGNENSATPGYPAQHSRDFSNTISVGAYSSSNSLAGFSNRVGNSGAVQVDAPGVNVYSTYRGSYAGLSGTSMAAPNVAGVAALALSANPDLSAAQLRDLIVSGATENIVNSDSIGRVNAASTVAFAAAGVTGNSSSASTTGSTSGESGGIRSRSVTPVVTTYPQVTQETDNNEEVGPVLVAQESSVDLATFSSLSDADETADETRLQTSEASQLQSQTITGLDRLFVNFDIFEDEFQLNQSV